MEKLKILTKIRQLSLRIQANERPYHHARCIEFLCDILNESCTPQIFIKWLDNADKEDFRETIGF